MENKILIPVDFEQQSIFNLNWAKYYAQFNNSKIITTHIIEENSFLKKLFKQEGFEKKLLNQAKEKLKNLCLENFQDENDYIYTVERGKPYEEIEDLAEEFNPHLIILGKNGNSQKGKKALGSNTLHIVSETDYPVVSILGDNKPQNANNTILLPLDLTKNYIEQITVALGFAKKYKSKIKAITVDNVDSIAHDSKLLVKMNKIKEFFIKNNIDIDTEIIETKENVVSVINKFANKLNPLLVIIMIREESNFKRFFIGSVAKDIIQSCYAPVLSVKPWDKENEVNPVFNTTVNPLDIV